MPLMARWYSRPFSAAVSRRQRRFRAHSRVPSGTAEELLLPASRRLSRGRTCHGWNRVRRGQMTPSQERCCASYKKSEAVTQRVLRLKYLGATSGLARLRTATGPNTDLPWVAQPQWLRLGQNHIRPQLPRRMVWFTGIVIGPNEARGFASSVCLALANQCQDLLQDTVTNTLSNSSREKPGFSESQNHSWPEGLGGRPK